jgi:hypothetical protein
VQAAVASAGHAPFVQLAARVCTAAVQLDARHCAVGYVQPFAAAAHEPPQSVPSPAQCARVPCGWPDVTCVHVPIEPDTSHALHESPQAWLQQYPSTQLPAAHSSGPAHVCPFAFSVAHCPPSQALPPVPALPAAPLLPAAPALPAVPALPAAPAVPLSPAVPALPAAPLLPALPPAPDSKARGESLLQPEARTTQAAKATQPRRRNEIFMVIGRRTMPRRAGMSRRWPLRAARTRPARSHSIGVAQFESLSFVHISVANCWVLPDFWMLQSMSPAAPLEFTASARASISAIV